MGGGKIKVWSSLAKGGFLVLRLTQAWRILFGISVGCIWPWS